MPAAIPIAMVAAAAIASNASSKASKAQAQAARDAQAGSDRQFDISRQDQLAQLAQQREDSKPYREAGYTSLAELMKGTAPGGEFNREFGAADFQQDPGYQFRLSEGEAGINRSAAANGSQYSGAALKALERFRSGLASQEYGQAFDRFNTNKTTRYNRLASLANVGQTSNQAQSAAGQSVYNNIAALGNANSARNGQYLQDAAEARASGYVANSNLAGSLIKGLANRYPTGSGGENTPPPDYSTSYESEGYGGAGPLY